MIALLTVAARLLGMSWANPLLLAIPLVAVTGLTGWHIVHERGIRGRAVQAAYAEGEQRERRAWDQAMAAEAARQKEIGEQALAEAQAEIKRLEDENLALAAAAQGWDHDADSAPDARERCLSGGSLLRLNRQR